MVSPSFEWGGGGVVASSVSREVAPFFPPFCIRSNKNPRVLTPTLFRDVAVHYFSSKETTKTKTEQINQNKW